MSAKLLDTLNFYAETFLSSFKLHDVSPRDMLKSSDLRRQYQNPNSFTDKLPFIEYLPEEQMFLMDDCRSVAAAFDVRNINVEGFPLQTRASLRDQLVSTLNNAIPQLPENPWVVEIYFSNTYSLNKVSNDLSLYNLDRVEGAENDPLRKFYLDLMTSHLKHVSSEDGIFIDEQVTGQSFGGKMTQAKVFLYRRRPRGKEKGVDDTAIEELQAVREKFSQALERIGTGVESSVLDGCGYYEWLFRWLNPNPSITDGDVDAALKMFPYPGDTEVPVGRDFSGLFTLSAPRTDVSKGIWFFDDIQHKYMPVELVRAAPKIGQLSAPFKGASLFDELPSGSIFVMKIVFFDRDTVQKDVTQIEKRSIGDSALAQEARAEAQEVKSLIVRGSTLLPVEMGFYIKASNDEEFRRAKNKIVKVASAANLQISDDKYDLFSCDSYLRMLPGNYRVDLNKVRGKSIKISLQHVANFFPLLGRGRGSGSLCQIQFNRGGEVMAFDCIRDRISNSHKVMLGTSGAGKSAKLVEEALAYAAMYNARIFIVEKGDSFKLVTGLANKHGRTTYSIKLDSKSNSVLPPYANAYKALASEEEMEEAINNPRDVVADTYSEMAALYSASSPLPDDLELMVENLPSSSPDDEDKDYLGEMELMTRIIVSGGDIDRNNQLSPADQSFIRRSILNAARTCRAAGKLHPLVEDVAREMKLLIETDTQMREKHKESAYDLGEAMNNFCLGLEGKLFNRYGSLWPEADITHIDMGDTVKTGKEAALAVAYASVLNTISDIAERDQFKGRPIIIITDEGHNFVSKTSKASPILVPAIVKIVKMMRKLNCWYWIASQNIKDFSDEAAALLKLVEWWEVLTVADGEDEDVAKFKKLDDEQKAILKSVTKENRKYTEGLVMCANRKVNNQLFRNVPPSLVLAVAMSDGDEKKVRERYMRSLNLSELDAAVKIAEELDKKRGFMM